MRLKIKRKEEKEEGVRNVERKKDW